MWGKFVGMKLKPRKVGGSEQALKHVRDMWKALWKK